MILRRTLIALTILAALPGIAHAFGYTVSGATVTLQSGTTLQTDGGVTLSDGQLDAGGAYLQVSGDWTLSNGSFVAGTSTVSFEGGSSSTSTLAGSTTFYSLQCLVSGKGLALTAGSTQTVQGTLQLAGASGNRLRVYSTSAGNFAYLVSQTTHTVSYVDAADNNAGGGLTIRAGTTSVHSGATVNWTFGAPAGASITVVNASSITLGWNTLSGTAGYLATASTAADFTGTLTSSATSDGSLGALSIPGLSPDTTYYLQLGALYAGATEYVSVGSTSTLAASLTGVQLANVFVTSVTVNWVALGAGQGYSLEASTAANFTPVAASSSTSSLSVTTLTVTGLAAHTTYYLRAGALNWQNVTNYVLAGTTLTLAGGPPQTPAFQSVNVTSVTVSWTSAANATGYTLEASTASTFLGTLISSVTLDTGAAQLTAGASMPLSPDTTYFIRAGALYNGATTYAASLSTPTLTALVTGAQFTQIFSSSITVNWVPLASAQGYRLEASTAADFTGTLFSSSTTDVALSTLTVPGLTGNTGYTFRVGGINRGGVMNPVLVGAATAGVGASPSNPTLSSVGSSSISVSWGTVSGTSGYLLEASTASDFSGTRVSSVTSSTSAASLVASSLTPDTTYFLRTGALYSGATSFAAPIPASTSTLTVLLSGAQIIAQTSNTLTASWAAITGAQGYRVDASTAADFSGTLFSSTTANVAQSTLVVSSLTPATTYYARAGGINWNGIANFVSAGSMQTLAGPAPNSPFIVNVYITSITVTWGAITGAGGYRLEASPASNFSGVLITSTTSDGALFRMTVTGLSASSQYYLRVASLWNGVANYAATSPAFAVTNSNSGSASVGPQRPLTVRGQLQNGGATVVLSWRAVTQDTNGNPTIITSYTVERSSALFGSYTAVNSVATTTYSETVSNQTFFYRVVAVDTFGNNSSPSDGMDSSAQTNRYVLPGDGTGSYAQIPDASNATLQSDPSGSQDIAITVTRRTVDETSGIPRSYGISAYRVATGQTIPAFSFSSTGMTLALDYAPASGNVAPYWINNGSPVSLANPAPASAQPLSVTVQNTGIYQVRSGQSVSAGFALQNGSPYPRVLTPDRPNENRRLFFLFNNSNSDPVSISIYDLRGRKVRDLDSAMSSPIPGSLFWDVKDDSGRIVPSGIYLYKIQAGGKTLTGSVVVAR